MLNVCVRVCGCVYTRACVGGGIRLSVNNNNQRYFSTRSNVDGDREPNTSIRIMMRQTNPHQGKEDPIGGGKPGIIVEMGRGNENYFEPNGL